MSSEEAKFFLPGTPVLPLQVLLDGIDEASDVKGVLQSYIMRRLVPMEISLVLTSRPEGVSADLSTLKQSFAIMSLKPLSDEQQKQIILNQEEGVEK